MANEGIDRLAKMLAEELPQSLRSVRDDLEKNFRSVLQSGLSKLDLVTREDFEVQEAVLQRTREKLELLEERLKIMESGAAATTSSKKKAAKKTAKKKSKKAAKKQS